MLLHEIASLWWVHVVFLNNRQSAADSVVFPFALCSKLLLIIVAIYGTVTTFLDGKFTMRRLLNFLERNVYYAAHEYYERQAKEWDI